MVGSVRTVPARLLPSGPTCFLQALPQTSLQPGRQPGGHRVGQVIRAQAQPRRARGEEAVAVAVVVARAPAARAGGGGWGASLPAVARQGRRRVVNAQEALGLSKCVLSVCVCVCVCACVCVCVCECVRERAMDG